MGRRYYCDYCNKTFIDDLDARKKHLSSSHHIKLRNLHYEMYRDPQTVVAEEAVKLPCRRFMQTGICQFAGNCKYTHYTVEELWNIKQQVEHEIQEKRSAKMMVTEVPPLETWLDKFYKKHNQAKNAESIELFWSYPEVLESRTDLPPSIKKFQIDHFTDGEFEEWGS
ncbi:zinc finger matrin-type protein 5 [Onthophagus taurus]|uniref:zinc finger matrin-type protein 5 n=1 Tax=Onthophagus taurus TaxID=166361 RepID=UPI000C205D95|nr:zinc finger matrin-type protein 5 [Onthophagus taurus]